MILQIKRISVFIFLVCFAFNTGAQTYPLDVNLFVPPPYPTDLDAYVDKMELGIVQINNKTSEPIDAFFRVRLRDLAGRLTITTEVTAQSILVMPGVIVLSPGDISEIFSTLSDTDINTSGLTQAQRDALLQNKQLPEGTYELCVFAFNAQQQPIADPEGGGCQVFEITYPERPIIDYPLEGQIVDSAGIFSITWSHFMTNPDAISRSRYILTMIDLTEQNISNIQNAFLDPGISPDYEEEMENYGFKIIQNNVELPLILGHHYAVRIQAYDPFGELAYQFGGNSEIVSFYYGENGVKLNSPSIVYPEDGMTVSGLDSLIISLKHNIEGSGLIAAPPKQKDVKTTVSKDSIKTGVTILPGDYDLNNESPTGIVAIDAVPAATLLLPYYEAGLKEFDLTYTVKIIDCTEQQIESDIDILNFEFDDYDFVLDEQLYYYTNSFLLALKEGHKYSMVIKVESEKEGAQFRNNGYSQIVYFTAKP